jgi:serine/threonine protein kinase
LDAQRWSQIEELFQRACECDPEQRIRLLEESGHDDPELRKIVEELLANQEEAAPDLHAAVFGALDAIAFPLVDENISHYRILAGIGSGGMGSVYKAEDLKLGRPVALKFLPDALVQDPVALKRLEQEARAASALNHPNVCTIYEIAEHRGCPFIVMEFLEGETLREKIGAQKSGQGSLSLHEQIDLGIQISAALAAAHASGIVHRDIKPANIFITRSGTAKILDFGVAKLTAIIPGAHPVSEASSGQDEPPHAAAASLIPTNDASLTRTGVTMGTAAYMSPEQVRGQMLDGRTDLFSFGLVLYEMATGHAAFGAATAALLREAILHSEPPPVHELNPDIPAGLALIISKALEKDRDKRYQTASDMHADLQALRVDTVTHRQIRSGTVAAVGVGVLLVVASIIWLGRGAVPAPRPDAKLRQLTTNSGYNPVISSALSPDGRYLAYSDSSGVHLKAVGADESRLVPQPDALRGERVVWEINAPAWFPDGRGFVATSHPGVETDGTRWSSPTSSIWVFPASGAAPHKLRDAARAWLVSPDGSVSFGTNAGRLGERELWVMASDGGAPHKVVEVGDNRAVCCWYAFPDGTHVSYDVTDDSGETLLARDLKNGRVTTLVEPSVMRTMNGDWLWLPDGRLIYSDVCLFGRFDAPCNYWIERFDLQSGKLREPARRLTQVLGATVWSPSVAADGRLMTFQQAQQFDVGYVADLSADATFIRDAQHYVLDESYEAITDWTPDSETAIVVRDRGNYSAVYRRRLSAEVAEPIVPRIDDGLLETAILSPDAKWIFLQVWPLPLPPGSTPPRPQVWRVPIAGGDVQRLFSMAPGSSLSCARAPATLCVIGEPSADRRQAIVSALDLATGQRGRELLRYDRYVDPDQNMSLLAFALSPDGAWLSTAAAPSGPLRILSLRGESARALPVKGLYAQPRVAWTGDGRGLIVSSRPAEGAMLLHVDLQGHVQRLLDCKAQGCFGVPSPDGRYLGITEDRHSSNIWMLENF